MHTRLPLLLGCRRHECGPGRTIVNQLDGTDGKKSTGSRSRSGMTQQRSIRWLQEMTWETSFEDVVYRCPFVIPVFFTRPQK